MSDLVYQNYNNKCKGWVNPSNIVFGPQIISLSAYQSPAGSTTVIAINGSNFFSYSTISFGTFNPTVYFVNSNLLQFYVPNTLNSGTYTVQVFNGSVGSNIVNYTIDNASGYWLLNPSGNISNTNPNGVKVSWLSRGAPININNNSSNPYQVTLLNNWIICDVSVGEVHIILPTNSDIIGREIMLKAIGGSTSSVINNLSIIQPIDGSPLTDIIIDVTTYKWVTIVFDGSNWITMQAG